MSLQIVEKPSSGLSRGFSVTVPAGELNKRLTAKIAEIAPQMNVKGFRPGKVPAAHVKRVHGKALMAEVLEQALNETSKQVLDERGLRIASQPQLAPTSDLDEVLAGGADLAYDLDVEIMPDFEPADLSGLELTRPTYEVADAEVDEALGELSKQARGYEPRTGKTVKAKTEDQVIIDFVGRVDGVAFAGGSATDTPLVLGSNSFIPGFEDQLVGTKPGETKIVKVTFPADYQAADLAGKDAEFEVTVKEVKAPADAAVDDELAKKLGLSDLAALRELMKGNLNQRYAQAGAFKLKRALLDVLDEKHSFDLPPKMVDAEFAGIWDQVERDRTNGTLDEADSKKTEKQLRDEYTKIAQRRVRLGLVLAEVGRKAGVSITDQELNQAMIQEAQQYGPQAQQAYEAFKRDANLQNQLRAPIYEAKVVEYLLSSAKITDKAVSREEMESDDDLPEQYGG